MVDWIGDSTFPVERFTFILNWCYFYITNWNVFSSHSGSPKRSTFRHFHLIHHLLSVQQLFPFRSANFNSVSVFHFFFILCLVLYFLSPARMIDFNVSVFSIYLICVVENCWFHTLMWTWMKEFLFHANDDYEYEGGGWLHRWCNHHNDLFFLSMSIRPRVSSFEPTIIIKLFCVCVCLFYLMSYIFWFVYSPLSICMFIVSIN